MSGHSKWSTIKRQKGVADAKRSQVFTKLAKAIAVAAKQGNDPTMNFKLRLAIDKAKSLSMPKDNIERAISRGSGSGEGANMEEITYEGYGPSGVAFIIQTLTDNRNRTTGNLRHLLDKSGGRLAETGSVAWQFDNKGVIQFSKPTSNFEDLELELIEAGVEDIKETDDGAITIYTAPDNFENVKQIINKHQIEPSYSAIDLVAKTSVDLDEDTANKIDDLREALDGDEDVSDFYDNAG